MPGEPHDDASSSALGHHRTTGLDVHSALIPATGVHLRHLYVDVIAVCMFPSMYSVVQAATGSIFTHRSGGDVQKQFRHLLH